MLAAKRACSSSAADGGWGPQNQHFCELGSRDRIDGNVDQPGGSQPTLTKSVNHLNAHQRFGEGHPNIKPSAKFSTLGLFTDSQPCFFVNPWIGTGTGSFVFWRAPHWRQAPWSSDGQPVQLSTSIKIDSHRRTLYATADLIAAMSIQKTTSPPNCHHFLNNWHQRDRLTI